MVKNRIWFRDMGNTKNIKQQIEEHEAKLAQLMAGRKEEIFNILKASGGVLIDNSILAGIAIYAATEEGKNNEFLKKLSELGSQYLPRPKKGQNKSTVKANPATDVSKTNITKEAEIAR